MRLMITILCFSASAAMLAGCGQKGPLYIAQDKESPVIAPVANDPQRTEEKRKNDLSAQ